MFGQGCGAECRERDALVGGTENHVEPDARIGDRSSVIAPQPGRGVARVEKAGIKKVRADAAGFQAKLAEAEDAKLERKIDEFSFKGLHVAGLSV